MTWQQVRIARIILFAAMLSSIACSMRNLSVPSSTQIETLPPTHHQFRLEAIDLSEDLSLFSTKNDEIILFCCSANSENSFWRRNFIFDDSARSILFNIEKEAFREQNIVLLLELDDEELESDSILNAVKNNPQLVEYFRTKNYNALETIFGDNDLLGILKLSKPSSEDLEITFSGSHKADRYEYRLIRVK